MQALIDRTADHVRQSCSGEGSGHDWWHIYRVWQTARRIARDEQVDHGVVELAALLHDIADWKFHGGDEGAGPAAAQAWLTSLNAGASVSAHVCGIIADLSFKGAGVPTPMKTREGMIVQDADRLDAIGAIGIARAFAYGGHAGRVMHDPGVRPVMHTTFAGYKAGTGTTINHFHEKLLLLKDRMNTGTARMLAEERHRFMEEFLGRFAEEWSGKQ